MTKEFMQTYQIYLTPLSPIHIGCGEDFEPTNYVIDKNVLYYFDPSKLILSDEEKKELKFIYSDFKEIHNFFYNIKSKVKNIAHYFSDVSSCVEGRYRKKIKNNNAKLYIERAAYLPYLSKVYIPGSSVKGALATAILDFEYKHNPLALINIEIEAQSEYLRDQYIGTLKNKNDKNQENASKLHYVRFSDLTPIDRIKNKITLAVNFEKYEEDKGGLDLFREVIAEKQYRSFVGSLTLTTNPKYTFPYTKDDLIFRLNEYYKKCFYREAEILLKRKLVSEEWIENIKNLIDDNHVTLIRLGKNGSDSKTYQDKNITQITTKESEENDEVVLPEATTVWLASDDKDKYLPFGWALLEFSPEQENYALLSYCDKKRAEIELRKQKQMIEEQQRLAEAKAKEEWLSSLSVEKRLVFEFLDKLENTREKQIDTSGSPLLKEAQSLLSAAVEWPQEEQAFIKEKITFSLLKTKIDFKKKDAEKNFKKLVNKLVGTN